MARASSITDLPKDVRDELKERLFESGFTHYDEHAAWLSEIGHAVSRSAVHRFGQSLEGSRAMNIKLRCLNIASRYSTSDTIVANAKALIAFVRPPKP